jgi:hypothetical protein
MKSSPILFLEYFFFAMKSSPKTKKGILKNNPKTSFKKVDDPTQRDDSNYTKSLDSHRT